MDHRSVVQETGADEAVRGVRQRLKRSDPVACPVCGVTVRPADMEQHCAVEIERLNKLHAIDAQQRSAKMAASAHRTTAAASSSPVPSDCAPSAARSPTLRAAGANALNATTPADAASSNGPSTSAAGTPIGSSDCWSTYQRIKTNRQTRLKTKSRKRKSEDPVCPVCNEYIADVDINLHVEHCLRRSSQRRNGHHSGNAAGPAQPSPDDDEDEDISIDVESESFDEYEWAGQRRLRASSLLQGSLAAAGVGTPLQPASATDEDEDLNVDGDDSQVFGVAQYAERDVIFSSASTNQELTAELLYLRKLVAGGDSGPSAGTRRSTLPAAAAASTPSADEPSPSLAAPSALSASSASECNGKRPSAEAPNGAARVQTACDVDRLRAASIDKDHIIEALKARLHERETLEIKCKCLICLDEFQTPVVSICCWHVYCEECWLRTLGARKLCPQCSMITSPADLRRVYM